MSGIAKVVYHTFFKSHNWASAYLKNCFLLVFTFILL